MIISYPSTQPPTTVPQHGAPHVVSCFSLFSRPEGGSTLRTFRCYLPLFFAGSRLKSPQTIPKMEPPCCVSSPFQQPVVLHPALCIPLHAQDLILFTSFHHFFRLVSQHRASNVWSIQSFLDVLAHGVKHKRSPAERPLATCLSCNPWSALSPFSNMLKPTEPKNIRKATNLN